ncbi:MAG: ATP-dependent helicase HrpB [Opitutales bacterium]|nr:ATP-dependent helicase HrpB [Opitutales bacterium]MDP4645072.1 ATP-dependent helicase HrpB [Opitutales bacterium]MDP4776891.1 ATP-dependent helicase HrpB [Opitutales bacterium]
MASTSALPIYEVADQIVDGLAAHGRVVLSAPTGSGKSTQVPQILIDRAGVEGEIVVLQPRRLAARLLAKRVAQERGGKLGEEVGYQIRFENVISSRTRIRFVTEAILLRQILEDPSLKGVGAVVFDEFHERHLTSDLSISCALQAVRSVRSDLKLVVMSATLDVERLETYLQPCARIEASGRMYSVEMRYMGAALNRDAAPVWERAAAAFRQQCRSTTETGDVLVFMPGAFEIRKTIDAIQGLSESKDYEVLPLHGELSPDAQDRAVSSGGRPKVIVSTNVAETSITIEGVRTVIDGGLARIARYDARRGINAILVEPISRASAEQRAGRAGRTGPGTCLRLWSEAEHVARAERDTPEVRRVDLSETLLMLAAADITQPENFAWFESPDAHALAKAGELLHDLGAIDAEGAITDLGRQMARFPLHPRYARMLIEADRLQVLETVALIAGLSQGRAIYRVARDKRVRQAQMDQIEDHADTRSDFFVHLQAWEFARSAKFNPSACAGLGIHGASARQAGEVARQLLSVAQRVGLGRAADSDDANRETLETRICQCLLAGFSDHLAKRNDRGTYRCRMVHGRSGELRRETVVETELFVAAEIEERDVRGDVTVLLGMATAVEFAWLNAIFPEDFSDKAVTTYDPQLRRVVCRSERRFRDLVLESTDRGEPDIDQAATLLATEVTEGRLLLKAWDSAVEQWIARLNFVAKHCPETEIAPIDTEARQLLTEQICHGALSYKEIKDRAVLATVKEWISPEQHYYIDTYAPATMELPRRRNPAKIRYEEDGRAFIASKLQDFYDVPGSSLKVANGKVTLLVELLAPNQRPAHLTDDLDGFWGGAYHHVRKELAGRYPKHEWR